MGLTLASKSKGTNGSYSRGEFLELYQSLEDALQGANLVMLDWKTIVINEIANLDDIAALFCLSEHEPNKAGLAILVKIDLDDYGSIAAKQKFLQLYSSLQKVPGIEDCSTDYAPFNFNKEVVDNNMCNVEAWKDKCNNELTMSYVPPKHQHDGCHTIAVGMNANIKAIPEKVRYLLEYIGAKFKPSI